MKVKGYSNNKILLTSEPLYKNGIGADQEKALQHCLIKGLETIKGYMEEIRRNSYIISRKRYLYLATDNLFKVVNTNDRAVIKFT